MNSDLDNPIWHALSTLDGDKNISTGSFKYFDAQMAPFMGAEDWTEVNQRFIAAQAPSERSWFLLIADEVSFIDEFEMVFTIPLYQLVCPQLKSLPSHYMPVDIVPLNETHIEEMIALTTLTKPGPFLQRTIEFGNYHGIFKEGRLAAMGGERLHVEGYTEISAICTHPDFQGLGYGAQITHFLASSVIQKGSIPFLHARYDNTNAIAVYERLGFEIRKKMAFYIFRKKQGAIFNP